MGLQHHLLLNTIFCTKTFTIGACNMIWDFMNLFTIFRKLREIALSNDFLKKSWNYFMLQFHELFLCRKNIYVHTSILLGRCICDIIWDSNWWSAAEVDTGCGYEFGSSSELFCCCGCIKYSPRLRAACLCFSVVLPGWRTRFLWRFSEDFCPAALADFPGWKIKIF